MQTAADRAMEAFEWAYGEEPDVVARAPGRVNLIGEHVDYNDGFVLPVAAELDVVVAASARADRQVRVDASDLRQNTVFHLDRPGQRRPAWATYVQGVAALIESSGVPLTGADLAFAGDVPIGAGLSSSAALEVAAARALLAVARRTMTDLEIVELCHRAESEWAGVRCGVMDQYASVFGREGHALFLDCRTFDCLPVPVPDDVLIIVTDSGVTRELQDSAYNDRVEQCDAAARLLGVRRLRDIGLDEFEARADALPELLRKRARHVVSEIARTREAASALEAGAIWRVGRYINESHESLREDYEVSIPELDELVHAARSVHGVYGSRLVGAGFGGCTVTLAARAALPEYEARVPDEYHRATGRTARVFAFRPGAGATLLRAPGYSDGAG